MHTLLYYTTSPETETENWALYDILWPRAVSPVQNIMTWKMSFHLTSFFPLCGCCILDKKWGRSPSFNPIQSTGQWTLSSSFCMELNNLCLIKTETDNFRKLKVLTLPAYSCCVFPCPPLHCASHTVRPFLSAGQGLSFTRISGFLQGFFYPVQS